MKSGTKYLCLQENGDKVGDEKVNKQIKDSLTSYTLTTLTKGTCKSVDWGKTISYSKEYDDVKTTAWDQGY